MEHAGRGSASPPDPRSFAVPLSWAVQLESFNELEDGREGEKYGSFSETVRSTIALSGTRPSPRFKRGSG